MDISSLEVNQFTKGPVSPKDIASVALVRCMVYLPSIHRRPVLGCIRKLEGRYKFLSFFSV